MKFTMGESKFGAPKGLYRAKFTGCEKRPPLEGSTYGPGVEWRFEIVEGEHAGKIISRTTSPEPSSKNACGRMLSQLAGGDVAVSQEIDVGQFLGRVYQVMVEANSTGSGTRVGTLMPVGAAPPTNGPPTATPAAAQQRKGPPPRKAPPTRSFWVEHPADTPEREMDEHALARYLEEEKLNPAHVKCALDGDGEWKTAADFGFKDTIPF